MAPNNLAAGQITGARDHQEDHFQVSGFSWDENGDASCLMVLADGMGNHAGGAFASELAVATFLARFEKESNDTQIPERFLGAAQSANRAIAEAADSDRRYAEMGSTLLACIVTGHYLHWVSVGDSPLWLSRDGQLRRLNADHSMRPVLADLVELGRLTAAEADSDPRVHQLRSALIGEDIPLIDQTSKAFELKDGDWVMLASDGVETLDLTELQEILEQAESEGQANADFVVRRIMQQIEARGRPHQDNATLIAYRHVQYADAADRVGHEEIPTILSSSGVPPADRMAQATKQSAGRGVFRRLVDWVKGPSQGD